MKKDKKILKSASIIVGALLTTSLAAAPSMGPDILAYNDLGSGSQVRSHLIDQNVNRVNASESTLYKFGELKCGEGEKKTADKKTDAKATDAKTADAKTTEAKASESKATEAKCGEGKCGEGKCGGDEKKTETKKEEKK